jgi:hypothetical protein
MRDAASKAMMNPMAMQTFPTVGQWANVLLGIGSPFAGWWVRICPAA